MRWLIVILLHLHSAHALVGEREDAAAYWRRLEVEAMKRGMQMAPEVPLMRELAPRVVVPPPDALPPLHGVAPWVPPAMTTCSFGWRSALCY